MDLKKVNCSLELILKKMSILLYVILRKHAKRISVILLSLIIIKYFNTNTVLK